MKKILFVNPPVVCVNHYQLGWYFAAHPTSILKLMNYWNSQGNNVALVDCMNYSTGPDASLNYYKKMRAGANNLDLMYDTYYHGKSLDWLQQQLLLEDTPDEVHVSCHITFNGELAHNVISIIKSAFPKAKILFGGVYPTLFPDEAAKSGASACVGPVDEAKTLFPDYDYLRHNSGYQVFQLALGCDNACSHCVNNRVNPSIILLDVPRLISHIAESKNKFGVSNFINIDPNIAKYNLKEFLSGVIRQKLGVNLFLFGGIQPDLVDKALVDLMRRANVVGATVPRESRSDVLNTYLNKECVAGDFNKAMTLLESAKFDLSQFHCTFPVCLRNESRADILDTIKEIRDFGATPEIAPLQLVPNTLEYSRHKDLVSGKTLEELNWALWPTLDSEEKIKVYSKLYMYARRFAKPSNYFST